MNNLQITYAQNREDILLAAFFSDKEIGFYVDVGAEDPTELSVTKIFYDRGWRGINVEPINRKYEQFVAERPRDINVNLGIADKSGKQKFREYEGTGYSTFSTPIKEEHRKDPERLAKKHTDYEVEAITLKELFTKHNVRSVQFLKVDVEGFEYEVLAGNDWKIYRPEVICIEANHVKKDWRPLLAKNNYSFVFFDGLNEYYADNTTNRAEQFNYVQKVIFKQPIVDNHTVGEILRLEQAVKDRVSKLDALELELVQARESIKELQARLNDVTPLKRHIVKTAKHHLKSVDAKITQRLSRDADFVPLQMELPSSTNLAELAAQARAYDEENYALYVKPRHDSRILKPYTKARGLTHKTARRVLSKVGRK